MSRPRTYSLDFSSDMVNLSRVAEFIADISARHKLTEKQADDVQMAVDEAITNVMEHAYSGRSDGTIHMQCRVTAELFWIEIRDRGEPFDPALVKEPNVKGPLSERSIGGLGIFFMRKLMDTVEFDRDKQGNITRMTKKLQ